MSALGQKQTSRSEIAMSALPPKADIAECDLDVRFVPEEDIGKEVSTRKKCASVIVKTRMQGSWRQGHPAAGEPSSPKAL
jgi:hypothetical protein